MLLGGAFKLHDAELKSKMTLLRPVSLSRSFALFVIRDFCCFVVVCFMIVLTLEVGC